VIAIMLKLPDMLFMRFVIGGTRDRIPDVFQCLLQLCHLALLKERNEFVY
jgi:hypothetical protein